MKPHIQKSAILFCLLTLIGCASTGGIRQASPIVTGSPVSIDFALVEIVAGPGDLEAENHLLRQLIISGLRGRKVFGDVDGKLAVDASETSGIKIQVDIQEIKKISRGERDWAGALAGRARIVVAATVSDLSSGKLIETFEAEGESSGGSNLAGTSDEAIQRAAEQVVAQVIKISRLTSP